MASMTACIAEAHAIREGQVAVLKKRDGRTAASGTAGRYAVLEGHICAMQRILRQTAHRRPAFSSTKRLEMAN